MHQELQEDHEYVYLDITASPTIPPPAESIRCDIPEKLLKILEKYKYNWRIEQLSKPSRKRKKFTEPKYPPEVKKPPVLNDEKKFYADQMARPRLKDLYINRQLYTKVNKKGYHKAINKNINKAWNSIYNYYRKKERDRKLRKLRQEQKKKDKKAKKDFKRFDELAKPKPVFKQEPIKRKPSKIFSNYGRLDDLALPKPCVVEPPKTLDVNPAALTYEPTEIVIRLAKIPPRFLNIPKPLIPGRVRRSALRYKPTPRIDVLAQPKQQKNNEIEDDFDPWAISKKALTYKATPRIIEMAKPKERD